MSDEYQDGVIDNTVSVPSKPQYVSETVLEDAATHPAYMVLLQRATYIVGVLGGVALVGLVALSWNDKPVPDGLANVTQWAVLILGVLLVGDALLGKLAVKA
jgi:hypothetical protein